MTRGEDEEEDKQGDGENDDQNPEDTKANHSITSVCQSWFGGAVDEFKEQLRT